MPVQTQEVTGVFAAVQPALVAQHFHHITITHGRPAKGNTQRGQRMFERQIGHQRPGNTGHRPLAQTAFDHRQQQLVAVIDFALRIDHDQPVGVTIQRDPEIGLPRQHRFAQSCRRRRAAILVDIQAIRRGTDARHLRTEFVKDVRRNVISRAMRTIDNDLQPAQIHVVRESALAEFDVAPVGVVDTPHAPQLRRSNAAQRRVDARLDARFQRIVELAAEFGKELDAVIVVRVVRG